MSFRTILLYLICILLPINVLALESPKDVDKNIVTYLSRINYWGEVFKTPTDYNDSLVAANEALMTYMRSVIANPASINYSLEKAQDEGLLTVTSEDTALRFYAWDTWLDQSLHCFDALAQYRTGTGIKYSVLNSITMLYKRGDPGAYYTDINTIRTASGKKVYLVSDCSIAGEHKGYEVKAYTIDHDTLTTVPFFKNGDRVTTSVDYAYKENYSGDTTGGYHGQFNSLHLSADKHTLYLPMISNIGKMDGRYYIYKFNGDMFVYRKKGEDKHDDVIK